MVQGPLKAKCVEATLGKSIVDLGIQQCKGQLTVVIKPVYSELFGSGRLILQKASEQLRWVGQWWDVCNLSTFTAHGKLWLCSV